MRSEPPFFRPASIDSWNCSGGKREERRKEGDGQRGAGTGREEEDSVGNFDHVNRVKNESRTSGFQVEV